MTENESASTGDKAINKEKYPLAKFDDSRLSVYMSEICRHADVAQRSIGSLDATFKATDFDVTQMFMAIQAFLASSGMISKLAWPVKKKVKKGVVDSVAVWTEERGKKLQKALALDDKSPLFSRNLRNSLEHYDERLDWFASKWYNTFILPWTVTLSSDVAKAMGEEDHEDVPMITWVDPESLVVRIMDSKMSLRTINDEIQRVGAIAAKWPGF